MLRSRRSGTAAGLLLLAACAGPVRQLHQLGIDIAENPRDADALRARIEILADWDEGPDNRFAIAARDVHWLCGRILIPGYEGKHRWFLDDRRRANVEEAVGLLQRALEWDVRGEHHTFTLGKLVEAETLLAEDQRNRSAPPRSNEHDVRALAWARQLSLTAPSEPYGPYAEGIAQLALGEPALAVESFERAEHLAGTSELGTTARLRRAEAYGRLERVDDRVGLLEAVLAESASTRGFAVTSAYVEADEFAAARDTLAKLASEPDLSSDARIHYDLACLTVLAGDASAAREVFRECVERCQFDLTSPAGLRLFAYASLWRWRFNPSEENRAHVIEVRRDAPLGDWERSLLEYSLGHERNDAWFLAAAETELQRRFAQALPPDELLAETWFYIGWKRLHADRVDATEAFEQTLALAAPQSAKWEIAFARQVIADRAILSRP